MPFFFADKYSPHCSIISDWVVKIPVILIMGVATTTDAPRNILSSNALQCLSPCKFMLGSPAERLDAIISAVLVRQCTGLSVGHKVATFLRNCFLRQDGTLYSLVRGLKVGVGVFVESTDIVICCFNGRQLL